MSFWKASDFQIIRESDPQLDQAFCLVNSKNKEEIKESIVKFKSYVYETKDENKKLFCFYAMAIAMTNLCDYYDPSRLEIYCRAQSFYTVVWLRLNDPEIKFDDFIDKKKIKLSVMTGYCILYLKARIYAEAIRYPKEEIIDTYSLTHGRTHSMFFLHNYIHSLGFFGPGNYQKALYAFKVTMDTQLSPNNIDNKYLQYSKNHIISCYYNMARYKECIIFYDKYLKNEHNKSEYQWSWLNLQSLFYYYVSLSKTDDKSFLYEKYVDKIIQILYSGSIIDDDDLVEFFPITLLNEMGKKFMEVCKYNTASTILVYSLSIWNEMRENTKKHSSFIIQLYEILLMLIRLKLYDKKSLINIQEIFDIAKRYSDNDNETIQRYFCEIYNHLTI